jgi:hypothetical protein
MPEATVSAGFCEGKADRRPAKCRNANRQGRTLRSWLSNIRGLAGFSLAELTEPTSLHLQQLIAGTDVIQSRNGTQPKSRWAYDNTEGISFEPRPQPTPIGSPAKDLMPAYIAGTAEQSGALFAITGRFAIREAQAAGTVSTSISGIVADSSGAASIRSASQTAGIASAARRPPA